MKPLQKPKPCNLSQRATSNPRPSMLHTSKDSDEDNLDWIFEDKLVKVGI